MNEFLKDYIRAIAECNGYALNSDDLQDLTDKLMDDDEVWQTLDGIILDALNKLNNV